ncbi:hypothetical protein [Tardiphaga sp. 813_E8_N1_3]|uniref:hypothetical protein n=1 Tax=Tardiphaga sp. 813_E8_N1_3 TaxID=3240760 RepID=UPI003F259DAE
MISNILTNAERLISDAEFMHAGKRSRSAATLIVIALEQLGAFVEALTRETYPDAGVHMGIFGDRANAHARRQDALAGHIMNYAFGAFNNRTMGKRYAIEFKDKPTEDFTAWLLRKKSFHFTEEEQADQRSCPDIKAAHILMHFVRTNVLKDLREYGLYEHNARTFTEKEIEQTIELAARVRAMLEKSWVTPEPFKLVGVNMPEGMTFDQDGKRLT